MAVVNIGICAYVLPNATRVGLALHFHNVPMCVCALVSVGAVVSQATTPTAPFTAIAPSRSVLLSGS